MMTVMMIMMMMMMTRARRAVQFTFAQRAGSALPALKRRRGSFAISIAFSTDMYLTLFLLLLGRKSFIDKL